MSMVLNQLATAHTQMTETRRTRVGSGRPAGRQQWDSRLAESCSFTRELRKKQRYLAECLGLVQMQ